MKRLYIGCGVAGALIPAGVIYMISRSHAVPGLVVDLGLLFFSLGMGLLFAPIGAAAGLLVAAMIHVIWAFTSRRAKRSRSLSH